ncbi:MAG: anaerobic ribonucleoside-triphosphate reductase [Candidatus Peribacteria bacterium]|nr:anaerobic ribonucleoside-triphosphate reductase [Candidatus Peribacteria bacterium]
MTAFFINEKGEKIERTRCQIYTRVMGYCRPVNNFNT